MPSGAPLENKRCWASTGIPFWILSLPSAGTIQYQEDRFRRSCVAEAKNLPVTGESIARRLSADLSIRALDGCIRAVDDSAMWRRSRRVGKTHMNFSSRSGLAFDPNVSAVGVDHVFHDFGPETRSTRFRADDALGEQAVANLRRHPSTGIDDGHEDCSF